jgi:hypothetical protein
MSLAEEYLAARGLPLSIAQVNGIEIDLHPDRAKIEQRLGVGCIRLWTFASEILWFPVYNREGEKISWSGRGLPSVDGKLKFVSPLKNSGFPTGIRAAGAGFFRLSKSAGTLSVTIETLSGERSPNTSKRRLLNEPNSQAQDRT